MKNKFKINSRGFTIIEVMIVLAIAGLIMVIVFLAVSALERDARDHDRKSLTDRVYAEINTYASNNQGYFPIGSPQHGGPYGACPASAIGCISDFINRYIGTGTGPATTCTDGKVNTCDPSLGVPIFTGQTNDTGLPLEWPDPPATTLPAGITHGQIYFVYGAKCNGESLAQSTLVSGQAFTATHSFALLIGLDRDGTDYCIDNG